MQAVFEDLYRGDYWRKSTSIGVPRPSSTKELEGVVAYYGIQRSCLRYTI